MEYYNKVDHNYLNLINRPVTHWKIKLELLDHSENTIDAIKRDIDNGNSGSISCNNEQGIHKSCSITLTNIDAKYTPDENNPFWFNRKFRLYIGIQDNKKIEKRIEDFYWAGRRTIFDGDTYWFAKGVFITQSAQCDSVNKIVTISGVDKYAQLDGTLNVLQADEMETVFRIGSNVKRVVTDTLMLNMGNGLPLDPIEPIIDTETANQTLYKEFTLSAGQYYGDFLNELATSFGCEIFYDNIGRLTIRRSFTDDVAYWNAFKAPSHEFENGGIGYMEPQESANLNGVNKIIVQTENIETPNASYTAINHNPQSPLCYDKIGGRTLPENGGIITINAGDLYQDDRTAEYMVMKRCKDYAEYRLMKETCTALEISFSCPMYPHINEGDIITITDRDFKLDHDTFIVNSITFNLGDLTTQMQVVNTQYLNTDINALGDLGATDYIEITYVIGYRITGATGVTPTSTEIRQEDQTFVTASGYDDTNHFAIFYKDGYEISNWIDNSTGDSFPVGAETQNPQRDCTLEPVWIPLSDDNVFEIQVKGCTSGSYNYPTIDRNSATVEKARNVIERVDVGTRKYYLYGRGQKNNSVSIDVENDVTLRHIIEGHYTSIPAYNLVGSFIAQIMRDCSNLSGGVGYSVKLPDSLTSYDFSSSTLSSLRYTTITFGKQTQTITMPNNFLNGCALETLDFNNTYPLMLSGSNTAALLNCSKLDNVVANNAVRIRSTTTLTFGNNKNTYPLPSMEFPNGLTLESTNYFKNAKTTKPMSIDIATTGGELKLDASEFLTTANAVEAVVTTGAITILNSHTFYRTTIKSLTINGDITHRANSNAATFLWSTVYSSSGVLNLNGRGKEISIQINGSYLTSVFIRATSNITEVNIRPVFNFYAVTTNTNSYAYVLCENNHLQRINFYSTVKLTSGSATGTITKFITDNPLLTDVYFYVDTVTIPSTVTAFANNNSSFTIHGIANGVVQTMAQNLGIPFVAITDAELAEAGL